MKRYLIHYGIEGMKWGIRRYQNEDGSLTSEGLERYGRHARGSIGPATYKSAYKTLARGAAINERIAKKRQAKADKLMTREDPDAHKKALKLYDKAVTNYEKSEEAVNRMMDRQYIEDVTRSKAVNDGVAIVSGLMFGIGGLPVVLASSVGLGIVDEMGYNRRKAKAAERAVKEEQNNS